MQPVADYDGDNEDLNRLQAGFPRFRIWREITCGQTRYVARSLDLSSHPHTVVTADLDELRATLSAGARCPPPTNAWILSGVGRKPAPGSDGPG